MKQEQQEKQDRKSSLETIDTAIENFFKTLKGDDKKLSVADVIRLLELRKQLASEQIREVKVTWVEASEIPSASNR